LLVVGVAALIASSPALAHHSPAAFDLTSEIVVEGTVVEFAWRNPHVYLTVEVAGPDGEPVLQEIEGGSSSVLSTYGMNRDTIAAGERVRVRARPSRRGLGHTVWGLELTKENGATLPFDLAPGARSGEDAVATSIAGGWVSTAESFLALFTAAPSWPLTERARSLAAEERATDLAEADCMPFGPPELMVIPVLTTIDVGEAAVTIDVDWMDAHRVVHLDGREHPDDPEPSQQGHSIGHWEGETLIVDTIGYAFDREGLGFGLPSGESKHIVERFTLGEDSRHLDYEITIEDPEHLTEPLTLQATWDYRPDLRPSEVACDVEIARRFLEEK
jgi:hypothetical protein